MQSTACDLSKRSPPKDSDLIQRALAGDQRGYEELVERYQNRLFASIRNDVGCATMAEDIVQDAFIRAFTHLDSFRGNSHFYTWLYRIALNSRRSYLRKNRVTVPIDSLVEVQCRVEVTSPDAPARSVERSEERSEVVAALSRLDENYRRILILREWDGFDYAQIAEILQVKMGTVRSRLARARARLRKELTPFVRCQEAKPRRTDDRPSRIQDLVGSGAKEPSERWPQHSASGENGVDSPALSVAS